MIAHMCCFIERSIDRSPPLQRMTCWCTVYPNKPSICCSLSADLLAGVAQTALFDLSNICLYTAVSSDPTSTHQSAETKSNDNPSFVCHWSRGTRQTSTNERRRLYLRCIFHSSTVRKPMSTYALEACSGATRDHQISSRLQHQGRIAQELRLWKHEERIMNKLQWSHAVLVVFSDPLILSCERIVKEMLHFESAEKPRNGEVKST